MEGFFSGSAGKQPICQCSRCNRCGFDPWEGKIPWRREWQPIPVFLPGEFYGQRSPVGCSPWGHKESDMSEHTCIRGNAYYWFSFPILLPYPSLPFPGFSFQNKVTALEPFVSGFSFSEYSLHRLLSFVKVGTQE